MAIIGFERDLCHFDAREEVRNQAKMPTFFAVRDDFTSNSTWKFQT